MEQKIGEPAFPRTHSHVGHNSMTLRDYFAAKAMIGWRESEGTTYEQDAEAAYEMADAMIKARQS